MRDELQYAREIQLSMLPDAPPSLDWVDVAGISIPATEVGGDYYDYFVVGDRLAIVSGDVAGHGLASGIVLATLRSGFTLLRDSLTDPAAVLARLHDLVSETSRRRTLVTCVVLLLDRVEKRATIANAAHPPVIVKRGNNVETIDIYTPPLGVKLAFEVAKREMTIEPGDVFVLHTDGVYEAMNERGDSYGVDRLVSLIASSRAFTAGELRDEIVSDVDVFRGSEKQRDDITVVVATIRAC
jgi:sigma-B regulation protein RsbU (phosphoserine phosphatase)